LRSVDWNPLGNLIATGATDRTLRVWNPDRPNVRYSTKLEGHEASVEKVAFNPVKDTELCSLGSDGVLKVWDVRSRVCVNEVKGLGEAFTLIWHPDGESLIVGNKVCSFHSALSPSRHYSPWGLLHNCLRRYLYLSEPSRHSHETHINHVSDIHIFTILSIWQGPTLT
jgi:THO complex subunit 3